MNIYDKIIQKRTEALMTRMKTLGFTVHAHNPEYTWILFTNTKIPGVSIEVRDQNAPMMPAKFTVQASSSNIMRFNTEIRSMVVQFDHPQLERIIDCIRHYGEVCLNNPPF